MLTQFVVRGDGLGAKWDKPMMTDWTVLSILGQWKLTH